jgi:hypothetical protein
MTSWRNVLKIHPAADLFPVMQPDELKTLGDDVRAHGMKVPIVLWHAQDDELQLLDGRNRLDALEAVGVNLVSETPDPDFPLDLASLGHWIDVVHQENDIDPYAYVISANIHRRHLTAKQKRELVAKVLKAQPGSSDRAIANITKVDHKTVAPIRADLERRGEIPHVEVRTDTQGRTQPAHKRPELIDKAERGKKVSANAEAEMVNRDAPATPKEITGSEKEPVTLPTEAQRAETPKVEAPSTYELLEKSLRRATRDQFDKAIMAASPENLIRLTRCGVTSWEAAARARCWREGIDYQSLARQLEPILEGLFIEGQTNTTVHHLASELKRALVECGLMGQSHVRTLKTRKPVFDRGCYVGEVDDYGPADTEAWLGTGPDRRSLGFFPIMHDAIEAVLAATKAGRARPGAA